MVGAARGYKVVLAMPETMSQGAPGPAARLRRRTRPDPGLEGMKGAVARAEEIVAEREGAVLARQFANAANPEVHRRTTAEEIWKDTDGQVDIVVAGIGTGGTITGVGEVLKSRKPDVQIIAVEPGSPDPQRRAARAAQDPGHRRHFVPEILNTEIYDEVIDVTPRPRSSGPARPPPRRGCSSASPRVRARGRERGRQAPRERRQDDRRHHPQLRRALPLARSSSRGSSTDHGVLVQRARAVIRRTWMPRCA